MPYLRITALLLPSSVPTPAEEAFKQTPIEDA
jgi:hypothetical protein